MTHPSISTTRRLNRSHRNPSHRGLRRSGIVALVLAVGVALLAPPVVPTASAAEYPSWGDVIAARGNQAAAEAKAKELRGHLADLETRAAETSRVAQTKGEELAIAQDAYDVALARATSLQQQADTTSATADSTATQAGRIAAQLYRGGGADLTAQLFLSATPSDANASPASTKGDSGGNTDLLSALGAMNKLAERNNTVYERATTARNVASAVATQAQTASTERDALREAASTAFASAREAADADAAAVASAQKQAIELNAKLAALTDASAKTAAEYQAGVDAAAAANPGGGGGGGGLPGGSVGPQGWGVPAGGRITDSYGPREPICGSDGCSGPFHYGTDIGTGCGAPIYAAAAGTVEYAGYYGTYGNFVQLAHGGGVDTGYAHIRPGGIVVNNGQSVSAGQLIAWSGTTGASSGCHLHFEVRIGGGRTDPVPFMRDRGAPLG
ncbi:M23 family metallopeptidase [Plantibacter sp. YIM 135249]|uniref:M23 family metallopeptidase n=1 Tax=Plantibacter sp. YIM 135249 TaxID=3423918 RepID=UPI003D33E7DF